MTLLAFLTVLLLLLFAKFLLAFFVLILTFWVCAGFSRAKRRSFMLSKPSVSFPFPFPFLSSTASLLF